ncbi:MAG: AbrB/MazE/SpoVT family DNA-binding domain-containing protein [Thermoanaerobaculia bacterium]
MKSATTRLSSRGQVVIPASVRRRLRLEPGDLLRVEVEMSPRESIVLRRATKAEMERALEKGYGWFARTGRDPVEELHEARRRARIAEHSHRRP